MTAKTNSGKKLNREWKVGAKHALYHKDGTFYEVLKRFPGALFDAKGYILFQKENEYCNCHYLSITDKTNVKDGKSISDIPGYKQKIGN